MEEFHLKRRGTNNDDGETTTAHLWIHVQIQQKHLNILLRNRTKESAKSITEMTKDKPWIKTFEELGGGITYSNVKARNADERLLETCIQIPYSFFLNTPSHHVENGE